MELPGKNANQFATGPLQALKISQTNVDATRRTGKFTRRAALDRPGRVPGCHQKCVVLGPVGLLMNAFSCGTKPVAGFADIVIFCAQSEGTC